MSPRLIFTDQPPEIPGTAQFVRGDALNEVRGIQSVDCWITSPPYFGQFDYGVAGQIGFGPSVDEYLRYVQALAKAMLYASRPAATVFWVIRDSYNGSGGVGGDYRQSDGSYRVTAAKGANVPDWPRKGQLLIPERTRLAFTEAGWVPRLSVIWDKQDARRSAPDRPSYSYEHVLIFAASERYTWNREAVLQEYSDKSMPQLATEYTGTARHDYDETGQEDPSDTKRHMCKSMAERPGALLRAVWQIPSGSQPVVTLPDGEVVRGLASFPLLLAEVCVCLGSNPGDLVVDPFSGMGTTALAAVKWGRNAVGIDLSETCIRAAQQRMEATKGLGSE